MKHVGVIVALAIAMAMAPRARADVVDACPHVWQSGYDGHGMTCDTNWPVVGGGSVICGGAALLIAGLVFFAVRTAPSGRSRGD